MSASDRKFRIRKARPLEFYKTTDHPWTVWLPEGQRWLSNGATSLTAQGAGVATFADAIALR